MRKDDLNKTINVTLAIRNQLAMKKQHLITIKHFALTLNRIAMIIQVNVLLLFQI